MIRLLHFLAMAGLVASAGYAYSIKYDTLYQAEELARVKARIRQERDTIAVLKAEWQHLNRPDRLQAVADKHLDLQPMSILQLARLSDLPNKSTDDAIAKKLEALGLLNTTTPKDKRASEARTPATTSSVR